MTDTTRRSWLQQQASQAALLRLGVPLMPLLAAPTQAQAAGSEHRLWYRRPADEWVQALPVGNGRLGAMVFGGTHMERLQLNENSFFSGGPYDTTNPKAREGLPKVRELVFAGRYAEAEKLANETLLGTPNRQMSYQPLAELLLVFPGLDGVRDYERSLDLDEAVATTRFRAGSATLTREVYASAADQLIVVRLSADKPKWITADITLTAPHQKSSGGEGQHTLWVAGTSPTVGGIEGRLPFECRLQLIARGGKVSARNGGLAVQGADEVFILIAGATGYKRFDDISADPAALNAQTLAAALARGPEALRQAHREDHQALFQRVAIDLGTGPNGALPTDERIARFAEGRDPGLAALYLQYGRYLLLASSRPGSRFPANLQGLWNEKTNPSWGSKWTININTEMNYWPAELCNLGETVEPLFAMVEDLAITGAGVAQKMFGAPGWVAFHNTDGWRVAAPTDGAQWGLWPMGGVWLVNTLWESWLFRRDPALLRRLYPLLKGAAEFQLATLVKDPKSGFMVTNPSVSPENSHPHGSSVCAGPAMDSQLLRDLFAYAAEAARELRTDRPFARDCLAMRDRLPPDRIGQAGQLQEWLEDWDLQAPELQHRHVSHLYALYPSAQITPEDTPALAAAARNVMVRRGDDTTGWGIGWRINLWARLQDGEQAYATLNRLLHPKRSYPNLFDAHPPFQIDGNFGGAAGIAELLLQSHRGRITLLPACPKAWPDGRVRGLCARGGFELAFSWRGGELQTLSIASKIGGSTELRWRGGQLPLKLAAGQTARFERRDGRLQRL
ncbi:glycoside hydrolase family 95 protein [Pelomonas sp. UHG3]|uniref:Glycoside hydrolase family 95 protein n=1 Tax=Roseateles hydrophilus TaxID=2975054 RepID=A0ACC6C4V5_9BURK|nr:glycoside hydrolase family 95 protein [Pelomonas sp. UHG3]MCY4743428.1 glycoside hydrolase family 95 protein [Pelomonas sp. UHG3]